MRLMPFLSCVCVCLCIQGYLSLPEPHQQREPSMPVRGLVKEPIIPENYLNTHYKIDSKDIAFKGSDPVPLTIEDRKISIEFIKREELFQPSKDKGQMTVMAFLSSNINSADSKEIVFEQAALALYSPKRFVSKWNMVITTFSFTGINEFGDLHLRHLLLVFEWKPHRALPQQWSVAFHLNVEKRSRTFLMARVDKDHPQPDHYLRDKPYVFFLTAFHGTESIKERVVGLKYELISDSNGYSPKMSRIYTPANIDVAPIFHYLNTLTPNSQGVLLKLSQELASVEVGISATPVAPNSQEEDGQGGGKEEEEGILTDENFSDQSFFEMNSLSYLLLESGFVTPREFTLGIPCFISLILYIHFFFFFLNYIEF
ncbi:hypothetical protein HMI56_007525 [Coelomomyces lativittatus]|nr:hypothetical protein HMI56_007525 [Coelomomyces lativittatus]